MKVLFVGPSLPQARTLAASDIDIRPPACQGDVMKAVADGATMIGIIDGQFGFAAPVWHKEILFALSKGIPVLGAASMGALRASECSPFGMIGVGKIFSDYAEGHRDDDADVALIFGPEEVGYPALSLPLVNVDATVASIAASGLLDSELCKQLLAAANSLFFKDRTWKSIATLASLDMAGLKPVIDMCWVDQKKLDSLQLLEEMTRPSRTAPHNDWEFNATPLFRKLYM